jgi:hypothetical protein
VDGSGVTRWLALASVALLACGASPSEARSAADGSSASHPPVLVDRKAEDVVAITPKNVELTASMPPLRAHPVGRQILAMLLAAPGVRDALSGTGVDPIRDIDWAYASGTSFRDDSTGALVAHFALDDDRVDGAFEALMKRAPTTAPLDLGVQRVHGVTANLAGADRALLRAAPSLVVVVPPPLAKATASTLATSRVLSPVRGDEALRGALVDPHTALAQIPSAVQRARAWVITKPDGGLDVFGEGDCADASAAGAAADELRALVHRYNGFLVRLASRGILDSVEIAVDGSTVKVHLAPTYEQLEAVLTLAGAALGVDVPPPAK